MEYLFYLAVKGLSAVYVLFNVYRFLFGKRAADLWRLVLPGIKRGEENPATPPAQAASSAYAVVGKSRTVYYPEEPPKEEAAVIKPAFSEDLQKIPAYEEEPDIEGSDVDDGPDEEILSENERFLPLDTEPDGEAVFTGMTFEQLSGAIDVVRGKPADEAGRAAAARILYEIRGSDVFDFLAAQAENEAVIEKLLKENLDDGGVPLQGNMKKRQRKTEEFDMDKYV